MKDDSKHSDSTEKEPLKPPFVPPETIVDTLEVPDETILLVPDHNDYVNPPHFTRGGRNRDWFTPFFYHCLPLVFGNQHGFLMLATYDFVIRWNGSDALDAISIHPLEEIEKPNYIKIESHFGYGILTVQTRYVFRTPKGVNLMVKEPPNYPVRGCSWMNAVVETDQLRRDFTFNIKVTQPNSDIYFQRGQPLGCIVPYPRYFLDNYKMAELQDPEELNKARRTINYFSTERDQYDNNQPRHRYMEGIDIYNLEFEDHQKSLDGGRWWKSKHEQNNGNGEGDKRPWWKLFLP